MKRPFLVVAAVAVVGAQPQALTPQSDTAAVERSVGTVGNALKAIDNGPQTFLLDGRQYIVVGAGDSLYAFALQQLRHGR